MILHFVTDEKVTDQIIQNFNTNSKKSLFLVFVNEKVNEYKHIKSTFNNITSFILDDDINKIIETYNPKAIVVHSFQLEYAKAIIKINYPPQIAWYAWGFDVYGLPKIKPNIYAPLTASFLKKQSKLLSINRLILRSTILRKIISKGLGIEDRYSIIYKAKKRVNYFVTYIEEEYEYYSKFYPNNFQFINCTFSTIDQYLGGNNLSLSKKQSKNNILIGNSNTIESNHIDAFLLIDSKKKFSGIEIFTPLNYGSNEAYKKEVIKKGEQIFGGIFRPILDFIDRKEYVDLLSSCSVGIFYHYRQQAMGNIIPMLYLGARVYLSSRNPALNFFKKHGIIIFDLDKDFEKYGNQCLQTSYANNNKKILKSLFSKTKVLKDIKNFIDNISE